MSVISHSNSWCIQHTQCKNMTMETTPYFDCWTSTQAGVRWLVRNVIRWPLFSTLFSKSACRHAVGICRSIKVLSKIFLDTPRGPFHWFYEELLVISIKYDLEYFIVRVRFSPDSQLGQVATIDFPLWDWAFLVEFIPEMPAMIPRLP